jgi:hypothetical protein
VVLLLLLVLLLGPLVLLGLLLLLLGPLVAEARPRVALAGAVTLGVTWLPAAEAPERLVLVLVASSCWGQLLGWHYLHSAGRVLLVLLLLRLLLVSRLLVALAEPAVDARMRGDLAPAEAVDAGG